MCLVLLYSQFSTWSVNIVVKISARQYRHVCLGVVHNPLSYLPMYTARDLSISPETLPNQSLCCVLCLDGANNPASHCKSMLFAFTCLLIYTDCSIHSCMYLLIQSFNVVFLFPVVVGTRRAACPDVRVPTALRSKPTHRNSNALRLDVTDPGMSLATTRPIAVCPVVLGPTSRRANREMVRILNRSGN